MRTLTVFGVALLIGTSVNLMSDMALADVTSLRGEHAIDSASTSAKILRWQEDKEPIKRDYIQQPPLVPHAIAGYRINLKYNKCLTCHSCANYKEAEATKISQTHFENRDGHVLANISARRYFCTQCHVPQVDAPPLVENEFEPIQAITGH